MMSSYWCYYIAILSLFIALSVEESPWTKRNANALQIEVNRHKSNSISIDNQENQHSNESVPIKKLEYYTHISQDIESTLIAGNSEETKRSLNATEIYMKTLNFTESFMNYMELDPFKFDFSDLKTHYRAVINGMTFIKEISVFIKQHSNVANREDAHVIYNLLDFYCALQKLRHQHLGKLLDRIIHENSLYPPGRNSNPFGHLIKSHNRTTQAIIKQDKLFIRSVLEPSADNLYLVSCYEPGGQPSLERLMSNLKVESPLMALTNNKYIIHPASRHAFYLGWDTSKSKFQLCDGHPDQNIYIRFAPISDAYGSIKYQLMLEEDAPGNHSLVLNKTNIILLPSVEEIMVDDVKFDVLMLDNRGNIALVVKSRRKVWWLCQAPQRQVTLCSGSNPTVFGTWTIIEKI